MKNLLILVAFFALYACASEMDYQDFKVGIPKIQCEVGQND